MSFVCVCGMHAWMHAGCFFLFFFSTCLSQTLNVRASFIASFLHVCISLVSPVRHLLLSFLTLVSLSRPIASPLSIRCRGYCIVHSTSTYFSVKRVDGTELVFPGVFARARRSTAVALSDNR
ncbi:hypothetical protein B0T26DRAFT_690573 [Lasiosphaeria miniovina]|uniref:Secreted protein n=1 Tax=Lasiosphaeria miniovina TaxID=1954250 RepID=A0AA40BIV9_9PEZI|nr:uncharacterized protein B0T26DRAFT_690573 [Lasiosphaeria miniovina]KAK0735027.1 hypothetical protein B0T26DRAFT_690573 [Lasiosphaeria miniovina]